MYQEESTFLIWNSSLQTYIQSNVLCLEKLTSNFIAEADRSIYFMKIDDEFESH